MEQVLLVVQVILAVGLIGMVLIQRSDSDGFGLGGGGGGVLSGRAQANLMTRTTAIFAALFIINSLALSVLASQGRSSSSIADTIEQQQKSDKSAAPVVPTDADKKGAKLEKKVAPAAVEKKADVKDAAPAVPTDADAKPVEAVKKVVKHAAPKSVNSEEPASAND